MLMNIEIELNTVKLRIGLNLDDTRKYFTEFITVDNCPTWDIKVNENDIKSYPLICPDEKLDPFSEAYLLMPKASNYLLNYNRVLIHGVSFIWNEKAWLITAPSGTGKTTQLRHWQKLWPDEIKVINGDKSLLELKDSSELWLHPSPWMGKERDHGNMCAQLAGIVILEQHQKNSIELITPRESVLQIFQQFLFSADNAKLVHAVEKIEAVMLNSLPIWLLRNIGDEASAVLTHDTLSEYLRNHYEKI